MTYLLFLVFIGPNHELLAYKSWGYYATREQCSQAVPSAVESYLEELPKDSLLYQEIEKGKITLAAGCGVAK